MSTNSVLGGLLPPALSRTAQVADWLARDIRAGRLVAGQKLPTEQELLARFGVSRTVIREAMATLRSEGLVISRQGSGVFVANQTANQAFRIVSEELRSLADVDNVLQLRLAVESEAAALAAERRIDVDLANMRRALEVIDAAIDAGELAAVEDFAFHRAVSSATRNPYFERFMHFLGPVIIPRQSVRPSSETPEERLARLRQFQAEHRRIFEAIEKQDVEGARLSLRAHLEASRARYRRMAQGQS